MAERERLSEGEWAVLAFVAERPTHGWAAVRALAPAGEIGRVWSVSRPLVYRALETLAALGLVEPARVEGGGAGPRRTVIRATRKGRARVRRWLLEPVEHVREIRSLLLLKLLFCERSGVDPTPLLESQRAALVPILEGLAARARSARGSERMLASFRLETARATRRFVDGELRAAGR
jgi:DNA-binding PadR family transcriptional regulator